MGYTFNKDKGFSASNSLPVGGYVCKIVAAPKYQVWDDNEKKYVEAKTFDSATRTVIPFDICEGEFKDYFQNKFENDDSENRKWKGTLILRHPQDTDKYDTNERRYNSFGASLMESNPNFLFKIDNNKAINGKYIGIVFREKEFRKDNGEIGSFAEPYGTYPVDDIRANKYKLPKKLTVKEDSNSVSDSSALGSWMNAADSIEEELPFA